MRVDGRETILSNEELEHIADLVITILNKRERVLPLNDINRV